MDSSNAKFGSSSYIINLYQDYHRTNGKTQTKTKPSSNDLDPTITGLSIVSSNHSVKLGLVGHSISPAQRLTDLLTWSGPRFGSIQPSKAQAHPDCLPTNRTLQHYTPVRRTIRPSGLQPQTVPNWIGKSLDPMTPFGTPTFGDSYPLIHLCLIATHDSWQLVLFGCSNR